MKRVLPILALLTAALGGWLFSRSAPQKAQSPDSMSSANESANRVPPVSPGAAPSARSNPGTVQRPVASTVSTNLQPILERWWDNPTWEHVKALTKNDLDLLVQRYQQETNLLKRRAMTVALAMAEDGRAVKLLENTLLHELKRNLVTDGTYQTDEEAILQLDVWEMGFLAHTNEEAYAFLKKGMDPWFWKNNTKWTTANGADVYGVLAGESIKSLARTGRPEISRFLEKLRQEPLINDTERDPRMRRDLYGAVVDAAFYYDLTQQRGLEYLKFLDGSDTSFDLFLEWKKTENGRRWETWCKEREAARPRQK